jgi:hypothetical protein
MFFLLGLTPFSFVFAQIELENVDAEQIITDNWKTVKSHEAEIDSIQLNKFLVGVWKFKGPELSEIQPATTLPIETELDKHSVLFERIVQFQYDMEFFENHTYRFVEKTASARGSGSWNYDQEKRELMLIYNEPYFANEMIKKLNLHGQESEELMIYSLTSDTLLILSTYPVNGLENWFYLVRFEKEGTTTPNN